MPTINVCLEVPIETYVDLMSGKLTRYGSVVRDNGKIVKHLTEVLNPKNSNSNNSVQIVDALKTIANKRKLLIGIGVAGLIAGSFVFYKIHSYRKMKESDSQLSKSVAEFNDSLCKYLDAIQNGNMDIDKIDNLMSDLDKIIEEYTEGTINIDLSLTQISTLLNLISEYTKKLTEANSVELTEMETPSLSLEDNSFVKLRYYLQIQKQVYNNLA